MELKLIKNRPFFILSFLPAIAYWLLEENASIELAVSGGIGLALVEFLIEKKFLGKIHSISKLNFFLILLLGGTSLIFKDGLMFKLQPFFTGIVMGGVFLFKTIRLKSSYMNELMQDVQTNPPPRWMLLILERDLGFFMFFYGCFMAYVAINLSTGNWLFFKTIGFYIAFIIFMAIELLIIRLKIKKQQDRVHNQG